MPKIILDSIPSYFNEDGTLNESEYNEQLAADKENNDDKLYWDIEYETIEETETNEQWI